MTFSAALALCLLSGLVTAAACRLLRPVLLRYALARPNARSSHKTPTPQGGGIAILAGFAAGLAMALATGVAPQGAGREIAVVALAACAIGIVGAWDDLRPLSPTIRLALQALAVGAIALTLPDVRILPVLPRAVELALVLVAGLWFVNLTNFMDGLDWLTVAGFVPLLAAIAGLGLIGEMPLAAMVTALALLGALIGFAPANRPVARLFMGDVGSLSIGLLGGYLLYRVAGAGFTTAALILPMYHVADATMTLFRRLWARERVWEAHRSHAYQRATDNGHGVMEVSLCVLGLNVGLAGLAIVAALGRSHWIDAGALALAGLATAWLIRRFLTPKAGATTG